MTNYSTITKEVKAYSDKKFAEWFKPFIHFENTPNEKILGIRVPILRKLAKKYSNIDYKTLTKLLQNNTRELRQLALFIMILKSKSEPQKICDLYLDNLNHINNWDFVDATAEKIVAPNVSKNKLRELSKSDNMWANRIAIVATHYYIKQNDFELTFEFAIKNIKHKHPLMHKASGWMLREVGKQNQIALINFLNKYSKDMPALMRSYSTEHLKHYS